MTKTLLTSYPMNYSIFILSKDGDLSEQCRQLGQ